MSKIALIGGAGFIGSNLMRMLVDAGHECRILDIATSQDFPDQSIICDVEDRDALTQHLKGVDVIYNLAAEHRDDVSPVQRYYDVNVEGAKNIAAAAEANNIKQIIFTSSVAVYGLNAGQSKESDTPDPFNHYGQSKLQAEEALNDWRGRGDDRSLVTMRLVATFGPRNRGNIYTLMKQIADGKFIMIGSGRNHKSVAYVQNVAAFLMYCLGFGAGAHLYNYADKPDLNMRDMVANIRKSLGQSGLGPRAPFIIGAVGGLAFDILAKLTGRKFPISLVRVRKFCADTVVNADKAHNSGFVAPSDLAQGLDVMMKSEFKDKIQ